MYLKVIEKDQTISKINKKFNVLKEKVTLLFDLEKKYDTLEKKIDEIVSTPICHLFVSGTNQGVCVLLPSFLMSLKEFKEFGLKPSESKFSFWDQVLGTL